MTKFQQVSLVLLRISLGWMFLYAGITKVLNSHWSAAGYLQGAKTFPALYHWFAASQNIGWVNFVNEWGLTLLGVSLILGLWVRLSSLFGIGLMLLYYFVLPFPHPNVNALFVDDHIIYIAILLLFAAVRAGRVWGLENWCLNLPLCSKFPALHKLLG